MVVFDKEDLEWYFSDFCTNIEKNNLDIKVSFENYPEYWQVVFGKIIIANNTLLYAESTYSNIYSEQELITNCEKIVTETGALLYIDKRDSIIYKKIVDRLKLLDIPIYIVNWETGHLIDKIT